MSSPASKPYGKTTEGELVDLYGLTNRTGMEVVITMEARSSPSECLTAMTSRKMSCSATTNCRITREASRFSVRPSAAMPTALRMASLPWAKTSISLPETTEATHCTAEPGVLASGFGRPKTCRRVRGKRLELAYLSKDGEEGFPGNLSVTVTFSVLADRNDLRIDYTATTEVKDTVLNLTNHSGG